MKKFLFAVVISCVVLLSGCALTAKAKASYNQSQYMSITGKTGSLVLHKYSGDVILEGVTVLYCGMDNDDLFYRRKGDETTYYYSGPCSFGY